MYKEENLWFQYWYKWDHRLLHTSGKTVNSVKSGRLFIFVACLHASSCMSFTHTAWHERADMFLIYPDSMLRLYRWAQETKGLYGSWKKVSLQHQLNTNDRNRIGYIYIYVYAFLYSIDLMLKQPKNTHLKTNISILVQTISCLSDEAQQSYLRCPKKLCICFLHPV